MADFAAVLRKAVEALKQNTPEAREKVYQKARATIEAKIAAVSPAPPPEVAERQRKLLEESIAKVESEYAPPPPPPPPTKPDDDLEDLLAELRAPVPEEPVSQAPHPEVPPAEAAKSAAGTAPARSAPPVAAEAAHVPFRADVPSDVQPEEWLEPASWDKADPAEGPESFPLEEQGAHYDAPGRSRGMGRLVPLLILLLIVGGVGYGAWLYRDDVAQLAGFASFEEATGQLQSVADAPETEPAAATPGEEEQQASATENASSEGGTQQPQKFTQRLLPDGREVDEGPAGDAVALGEGTSVAASTPATSPPAQGAQAGDPSESGSAGNGDQSVQVGQRAIFYEEGTAASQGSAHDGSVVWSVVQESPGDNLPPEPAVRAEATIADKGLQLKMTIRRNADESLPASHIIELIFLTPENFEGGGINGVLRVAMKQNEQDTGSPLLGVPAKIADGFFLVALSDSRADQETNSVLMRRQSWIDIPVVYTSGRRALITLEKGVPGERVFGEALEAWQKASSG